MTPRAPGSFASREMEAERLVGPIDAGDETLAARIRGDEFIADAAGEPRGLDVELVDDGLEIVVGLGNGLAR